MNVDDIVAARVAAAHIRTRAAKRRRDELSAARKRGLTARNAAKLRRLNITDLADVQAQLERIANRSDNREMS